MGCVSDSSLGSWAGPHLRSTGRPLLATNPDSPPTICVVTLLPFADPTEAAIEPPRSVRRLG